MAQITYSNKVALNSNSGIADINKCNASDMNEIKTVVNTNANDLNTVTTTVGTLTYNVTDNGSEVKTGTQYNGKDLYVKRFYWSTMPSSSTSGKSLGFSLSATTIFKIDGYAVTNSGNIFPLTSGDISNDTNATVQLEILSTGTIQIKTVNGNFASGKAYANVYYIYN